MIDLTWRTSNDLQPKMTDELAYQALGYQIRCICDWQLFIEMLEANWIFMLLS